jgi:hypothetical protein
VYSFLKGLPYDLQPANFIHERAGSATAPASADVGFAKYLQSQETTLHACEESYCRLVRVYVQDGAEQQASRCKSCE